MVTSVTKGGTQKLPQMSKIVDTDMPIHWKALEDHFMMVPLVCRSTHFRILAVNTFSEFSESGGQTNISLL
jgi:hypothetical protein